MFSNMFVTLETDILTLNEGEFHELPCSDNEDDELINTNIYVGWLYINEFKKWKPYSIKTQDTLNKILYLEKKYNDILLIKKTHKSFHEMNKIYNNLIQNINITSYYSISSIHSNNYH